MNKDRHIQKAHDFRALHHEPKLLVLPNVWDALGARMLESLGYPAVATASAAVAFSMGYDDDEKITFAAMLEAVRRVADSVSVPVTADIERGYAEDLDQLRDNIRRVIATGVVGINIEDNTVEGASLRPVEDQSARIRAVREAAEADGIPLVINARTDVFLRGGDTPKPDLIAETVRRGRAYVEAGADCVYPITLGDVASLKAIRAEIDAPINVYAGESTAPMRDLEAIGIARLSIGPGLLRAALTAMKTIAGELQRGGSYEAFTLNALTSDQIRKLVRREPMR